jgi:hypothetical protein
MKKSTPILIVAGLIMLLGVGIAYAPYPTLSTGYAIDSNYHGINVPPGANVIVTAYTTDADVYQVTFLWKNPGGNTVWTDVDNTPTLEAEQYDGMNVYTFSSEHAPDVIGDWGVQALFQSPDGTTKESTEYVVAIRATSFFVVPDFPMIGTLGSLGAMLLGLGLFIKRKSKFAK